jgi:hypothetical protein
MLNLEEIFRIFSEVSKEPAMLHWLVYRYSLVREPMHSQAIAQNVWQTVENRAYEEFIEG